MRSVKSDGWGAGRAQYARYEQRKTTVVLRQYPDRRTRGGACMRIMDMPNLPGLLWADQLGYRVESRIEPPVSLRQYGVDFRHVSTRHARIAVIRTDQYPRSARPITALLSGGVRPRPTCGRAKDNGVAE